ncbi:MAG: hypothetical protein WCZ43_03465 [Proteiniphilum sp.]
MNETNTNYSKRRFITIASIGLVSSVMNYKIFSGNGVRKQDQHFVAGNHHLFFLNSSCVKINGKTYGAQSDERGAIGGRNSNRHSIAGTGESGCGYIAKNNIECGESLSHCFDMFWIMGIGGVIVQVAAIEQTPF